MHVVIAIFAAYALTGIFCVWRDLGDPIRAIGAILHYQTGGGFRWLLLAGVIWLPATLIAAYWQPGVSHMKRELTAIAVFVAAAIAFWIISN